jgi:anti-anti-sigma factor
MELNFLGENEFNSMKTGVNITVKDNEDELYIKLNGYLDTRNSGGFMKYIIGILDKISIKQLVIDVEGVEYISSTGAGSFTAIFIETKKRNIDFKIKNPNEKFLYVIKILGFESYLSIIKG